MSYLGYDRGRLLALRRRIGDLADEAAGMRFADPLAADAARSYRNAVALITGWVPDLALIDSCAFGSPYRPVALDPADPGQLDVLHPTDAAWTTVVDPRPGADVSGIDHARHVAEYLAAVDITTVLDDRRTTDAVTQAVGAVLADPAERGVFLGALGPDGFARVSEDLARVLSRRGASTGADIHADRAAGLLQTLARGFGAAFSSGAVDGPAWETTLGEHTEPYATALVLRDAGLGADALARLAVATWQRWASAANDDIDELAATPEQVPAIIIETLTAQPQAARDALASFTAEDLALLFGPDIDQRGVLGLLLASADPRLGPADDAERSVVNVVRFLAGHQALATAAVRDGLGAYVGPYLENLLGASDLAGYPARRWDLGGGDPIAILGWIPRSPVAAASLEAYLDAIVAARFGELAAVGPFDDQQVHHLGAIAGTVDRMIGDARVLAAEQRNEIWQATADTIAGFLSMATVSSLDLVGIGASKLVNAAVASGVMWVFDQWQANGGAGAPAPVEAVVAAEGDTVEQQRGRREAAYLGAVFAAGRAAATMPASATPPPFDPAEPYLVTRNRWVAGATDPADAAARQQLWRAAEAFDAGMSAPLSRF